MALTAMPLPQQCISPAVRSSDGGEAACSALRAYMSTLGWPGSCSMHLAGFGGYCLHRCPLEVHMHLHYGFELNWSQNPQYSQTSHACPEGIL